MDAIPAVSVRPAASERLALAYRRCLIAISMVLLAFISAALVSNATRMWVILPVVAATVGGYQMYWLISAPREIEMTETLERSAGYTTLPDRWKREPTVSLLDSRSGAVLEVPRPE
jgi:hypothetical protein